MDINHPRINLHSTYVGAIVLKLKRKCVILYFLYEWEMYDVKGRLIDGAAAGYFLELGLLDVGAGGRIAWLVVHIVDGVVGTEVLHGLTMLVHVEIGVFAEVVVLRLAGPHYLL